MTTRSRLVTALRGLLPVLALAAVSVLAGCSSSSEAAAVVDTDESAAAPLPAPTGEVVLTVAGAEGVVDADLAGIEGLGTVTTKVYEPFIEADVEFTGVPVDVVLAAAGVPLDAPLTWVALDDYEVSFTRAAAAAEGALLATRQDGAPIPVADGGPIRVVFPQPDAPLARDLNLWIWSARRVEVG